MISTHSSHDKCSNGGSSTTSLTAKATVDTGGRVGVRVAAGSGRSGCDDGVDGVDGTDGGRSVENGTAGCGEAGWLLVVGFPSPGMKDKRLTIESGLTSMFQNIIMKKPIQSFALFI